MPCQEHAYVCAYVCVVQLSIVAVHIASLTPLDGAGSELAKICTASLVYDTQHLRELFGVVPTSSIIVQVGWNEFVVVSACAVCCRSIPSEPSFHHSVYCSHCTLSLIGAPLVTCACGWVSNRFKLFVVSNFSMWDKLTDPLWSYREASTSTNW